MNDVESIFKSIISFFMEELELSNGDKISRLNYYIEKKNEEKNDNLLDKIPNRVERFVLNQRMKDVKAFKNWIDLAVDENVKLDANFNTAAKEYAISVDSLIYDDLSGNTFYKSIRMAEVLKNIMSDFLEVKTSHGFMYGEVDTNTLPERVSVEGTKALRSGVIYLITIQ